MWRVSLCCGCEIDAREGRWSRNLESCRGSLGHGMVLIA